MAQTVTGDTDAVAMRQLELEFELPKMHIESEEHVAVRRAKLQFSAELSSSGPETSNRPPRGLESTAQCAKVLNGYRLPGNAGVPLWFEEVEKLFSTCHVPDSSRVHLIMPALTERVHYLLLNLDQEDCQGYEFVKQAVLSELKLTPGDYLERFSKASKSSDEIQNASRVKSYFAYYLQLRGADMKEAITELMIADQIKQSLIPAPHGQTNVISIE